MLAAWRAKSDAAKSTGDQVRLLGDLARIADDLPASTMAAILVHELALPWLHPQIATYVTYLLAQTRRQQGDRERAEALWGSLGFQGDWAVLGPFAADGRGGLGRVFAPEQDLANLDPASDRRFLGKEREVGWRTLPASAFVGGAVFLDAVLRPDNDAVAYLVGYLRSDRDQGAVLRIGSSGPIKVWVGGQIVHSKDVLRPAMPDQDAGWVWLRKGVSRVVVKTVVTSGPWRLFFRVADESGKPLPGIALSSTKPPMAPTGTRAKRPGKVADVVRELRARAEATPKSAQAQVDHARALRLFASEDIETHPVEAAARKALSVAEASGDGARVIESLALLADVAHEDDDRRAALSRLVPLQEDAKDRAETLYSLGRIWQLQERDALAIEAWRKAEAADPTNLRVQIALAGEEQRMGQPLVALARLSALPQTAQSSPSVLKLRADLLMGMGRVAEAGEFLERLGRERRSDVAVIRDLVGLARLRGDASQAVALLREAQELRPDLDSLRTEEAAFLEGLGRSDEAIRRIRDAIERVPDEAGLYEELGRLEARTGRMAAALADLRRSLVLRPQNPVLRRYVEHLAAEAEGDARRVDDLSKRYALDAEVVARAGVADPESPDESSVEKLLERTVVRVHGNGLSDRFVQRIFRVKTDRAAKDNQEVGIRYEPGRQEVEVRSARVFHPTTAGGLEISLASSRDDRSLSEPWYGLYYDTRAVVVGFDTLKPGDIVEVQYSVSDLAFSNEFADYFGDFQVVSSEVPTRRWDYTLIVPRDRSIYFNPIDEKILKREVTDAGNDRIYAFTATNVPKVASEPGMPGFAEVATYLHASTYKSWEDVGKWYWRLVSDQLTDDGTLKNAAVAATLGERTLRGKVKAIHRLVMEGTRYVGLEFGIHGYKPYRPVQVLSRKFGDCKDKATLLMSLLNAVGIDCELVLLRTRRGGDIDPAPASLAVFDHAIAYVPELDLYIDGTAEFSGIDELPAADQNVMALRVTAKGATLVRTPSLPASANQVKREWRVTLAGAGAAVIDEQFSITGQSAHEWREHYQSPGERRDLYAKVWSGRFAGAKLENVDMTLTDRNRAATLHARVSVPRLGEVGDAGLWRLPLSSREGDFTRTYARLSERKYPLLLGFPWHHRESIRYELPPGYRVVSLPSNRTFDSKFGQFEVRAVTSGAGRSVDIESTLRVDKNRIEPSDYPAFRAFLSDTDAALSQWLVVGKGETR